MSVEPIQAVAQRSLKLLVATEFSPNASGGGPAVVRQMLRGWPADDLYWWSCLPERDKRFGQQVKAGYCAAIPSKLMPHRRFARIKSMLLERWWVPFATAHLSRTMKQVKPDAVWVIPHNWSILPLAAALPGAQTGFHVTMQDYADVHGQLQKFGPSRCRRMVMLADRLYSSATTRDATSHPMIEDLKGRTQADASQMLHAGLEEEDIYRLVSSDPAHDSEIRIAYAGTILVAREFALFVKALQQIRSLLSRPVHFDFFGAHSYAGEPWFDLTWMREHGNLPEPELLNVLRGCTWGFAPMSLEDDDPRYNRFSFPTKFITYLAAGLPVITLGHPESSVMKMASSHNVGLTSSANDVEVLARQLRGALDAPNPRMDYRPEILRCAKAEFNATQMRKTLYQCFERCRNGTVDLT